MAKQEQEFASLADLAAENERKAEVQQIKDEMMDRLEFEPIVCVRLLNKDMVPGFIGQLAKEKKVFFNVSKDGRRVFISKRKARRVS